MFRGSKITLTVLPGKTALPAGFAQDGHGGFIPLQLRHQQDAVIQEKCTEAKINKLRTGARSDHPSLLRKCTSHLDSQDR